MADEVTYICKRTVISTKPVEPGKSFPISVLDRVMERNNLRIVYYFKTGGGRDQGGEITKKLRESISEILTYYPIMTGRLVKNEEGNWMIKCNDAGVRLVEAKAKGSVEQWLESLDWRKELKLIHWEEMFHKPYFWSTFYVQITEFEEGGLAIGLSCSHMLADFTCATMFIKAWAETTLDRKMMNPPLCHPLPARRSSNSGHNHYTHLINFYKFTTDTTNLATGGHATIAFKFTDSMVRACMAMVQTTEPSGPIDPTPFQALAGLFWTCISKIKRKRNELMDMCVCLDVRKKLGLDDGFFGNCMVYNKVQPADYSSGKDKLSYAIRAIEKEMAKMEIEGTMDLIEWLEFNNCKTCPLMNGCDLICACLDGVDPYLAMFEEGYEPIRVSCYVEPFAGVGHVLVIPSPRVDGGMSRVVMVTLPEAEVVRLCEDELLLSFSPTILMGIKKMN